MRRSLAPSAKKSAHRRTITEAFGNRADNEVSSSSDQQRPRATAFTTDELSASWGSRGAKENYHKNETEFIANKIIFNIVWREFSNKKHKTWTGDGTLEIYGGGIKAVLKDDTGKYMGCTTKFKLSELDEGVQLTVGGKEVELQDKIKNLDEYFAQRKQQMANRGWGTEEWQPEEPAEKKPKAHFVFRPNLVLPKLSTTTTPCTEKPTTSFQSKVEPLILITPDDTPAYKYNKLSRPVHEVRVAATLAQHLSSHQREGVQFLYACVMGFRQPGLYGTILADEIGLGKTLQCLALAHTLLCQGPFGGEPVIQRVLIIAPSSLISKWNSDVSKWLKEEHMQAFLVNEHHQLQELAQQQHIPFVIVSYDIFLANAALFEPLEFDLLICDEGHNLKDNAAKLCVALRALNIMRRILLTNLVVHNKFQEFYSLADLVNPCVFGSYAEFRKHYELPIVQSQCPDASDAVLQLAIERSFELNKISAKFVLRRTQGINSQHLPKKREYVVFVKPSQLQQLMLQECLELYEQRKELMLQELTPLQIITILKTICNHPSLVARTKLPNMLTRRLEHLLPDWSEMGPFDSAKLEFIQNVLSNADTREKLVIVSYHTMTLNMLQGLCDHLNLKCLRLNGATTATERNALMQEFNTDSTADSALVFLLNAKAGSIGLNLCGASRLILFDNDWNSATDAQSMSCIWRDDQQRDIDIYRLITAGTIEEHLFQRQVAKMSLDDCLLQAADTGEELMQFSAMDLLDLLTLQTDLSPRENLRCRCSGNGKVLF